MSNKQTTIKKTGLGESPLSLFTPTSVLTEEVESAQRAKQTAQQMVVFEKSQEQSTNTLSNQRTTAKSAFLLGVESNHKESIGLQVTTEINDWLDQVVKAGRRKHGKKLQKQVIIQAGVELLRAMPVDWTDIVDLNELRATLEKLSTAVIENT